MADTAGSLFPAGCGVLAAPSTSPLFLHSSHVHLISMVLLGLSSLTVKSFALEGCPSLEEEEIFKDMAPALGNL